MRSTLFFIPHEIAGITVFGFGWLLAALFVGCLGWVGWTAWRVGAETSAGNKTKLAEEIISGLPIWGVAAVLVMFVLPNIEQTAMAPGGTPIILGLPIRGYGVLVLIGLLSGIGITIHRGRSLGISPDLIISLGFWMMLGGVAGARIFYVVQKWDEFSDKALGDRLVAIFKLTEGGLVIYGAEGTGSAATIGDLEIRTHPLNGRAIRTLLVFAHGHSLGRQVIHRLGF